MRLLKELTKNEVNIMTWSHGFANICKQYNISRRAKNDIKSLMNTTIINDIAQIEYERNISNRKLESIRKVINEMCDNVYSNEISQQVEECLRIIQDERR
jgi:hypothetical protein